MLPPDTTLTSTVDQFTVSLSWLVAGMARSSPHKCGSVRDSSSASSNGLLQRLSLCRCLRWYYGSLGDV